MTEGSSAPEQSTKGLRNFIDRANIIKQKRNKGNKDAVLRAAREVALEEGEIDKLTNIPNLRGYERRKAEIIAEMKRLNTKTVVMVFDLDKLKIINDREGHEAGNRYIQKAAETIKSALRPYDVFARTGGDEFTALLPRADADIVRTIWDERILPLTEQNGIAVSGGASELNPDNPKESEEFADKAMYGAKKEPHQRNQMFVKEPFR